MKLIASLSLLAISLVSSIAASADEKRDTDLSYMRHAAAATHQDEKRCTNCPMGTFAIVVYNSTNGINNWTGYLNIIGGKFILVEAAPNPPIFYADWTMNHFGIQIVNKPALAGQYLALKSAAWGNGDYSATGHLVWHAPQDSAGISTSGWTMGPVAISPNFEWAPNKYYSTRVYSTNAPALGEVLTFDVTLGGVQLTGEQQVVFGTTAWSGTQMAT